MKRAMTKKEFEAILDATCKKLTEEAQRKIFTMSPEFEMRVRELIRDATTELADIVIDFKPHPQAFPDIAVGEFGIEVKFTLNDTWRSVGNSVLETNRIESVKHIYIVFGKMDGTPQARWGDYESSVIHVRTSHVPRFEVELPPVVDPVHMSLDEMKEIKFPVSLFETMGISYDEFRHLDMPEKMKYIRKYAKSRLSAGERLWWIEDDVETHSVPIQVRLYVNLSDDEKVRLRAEAAMLCPSIVKSRGAKGKYDDAVLYLLTYHGVLCHQA
jgi:hypothetical protein